MSRAKISILHLSIKKSMKKILLLNPCQINIPDFNYQTAIAKGYPAYPSMGLGYLSSVLKSSGKYEIIFHDNYFEGLKIIIEQKKNKPEIFLEIYKEILLKNSDVDIVCISLMFSSIFNNFINYVKMTKELLPKCLIITGGSHITCAYESVMKINEVDYALMYEADKTILLLLDAIKNNKDKTAISGLVYRNGCEIIKNERTFREENLDNIPSPDWIGINMPEYYKIGRFGGAYAIEGCEGKPFACITTSRGCRGHCAFCSVSDIMGGSVRMRSPEPVADEIGRLYNEYGIKFFEILDDDFTFSKSRALSIMNEIVKRGYDIRWTAKNGLIACSLDEELIEAMSKSGCRYVQIGVESGNESIIKWLKKPLTFDKLIEVRKLFRKFPEIYLAGYFIVGFPEETYEMMKDTYNLALKLQLDWCAITMAQPLPNTRMFQNFVELGIISEEKIDWSDLTFFHNTTGNKYHSMQDIMDWWHEFNIGINFVNNPNLNGGDLDRAIRDFHHVAYLVAPGQPMALYCLGKAYLKKNNILETKKLWAQVCETIGRDKGWQRQFEKFNIYPEIDLKKLSTK